MIRRIVIERFKSFERVDLTLGHFNLFIGPNASGKSNFLDALRVLQGIGYGLTIDEILNGKPKSPIGEAWEGIRGGDLYTGFARGGFGFEQDPPSNRVALDAEVALSPTGGPGQYRIVFDPFLRQIVEESLTVGGRSLFSASMKTGSEEPAPSIQAVFPRSPSPGADQAEIGFGPTLPVLSYCTKLPVTPPDQREACSRVSESLADLQSFDPAPRILRQYSSSASARRMGSLGEDFASVVKQIGENGQSRKAYLSWLKQLTPRELDDIHLFEGALKEPLFGLRLGLMNFPAPVLSDGTLRFAALAAAFFQPSMPRMMAFEEIENGVHPSRLRLVLDLMRSQSKSPAPQVFATSHSPVILDWLNEEDYPFVFLCRRNAESGASEIRTLAELLKAAPPGDVRLSDLAVEGWFEAVP